jgi:hypothetical protein
VGLSEAKYLSDTKLYRKVQCRVMNRKPRREWEAEYVAEYCTLFYRDAKVIYHARLGTFPPELKSLAVEDAELSMLSVYKRWCDALAILENQVHIIEGKLLPHHYLKGITELELYITLFKQTPEYRDYRALPTYGVLVVPVEDPVTMQIARSRNIRMAVYKPTFWDEFWQEQRKRWTRPTLVKPIEFYKTET